MADLGFIFCPIAFEVRQALDERRIHDAIYIASRNLGMGSQPFLDVVKELLNNNKKEHGRRGPKHKKFRPHWLDIGSDYQELRESLDPNGILYTYEKACETLAERYGFSASTIRSTVADYLRGVQKGLESAPWLDDG